MRTTCDERSEIADGGAIVDVGQLALDQVVQILTDETNRSIAEQKLGASRMSAVEDPRIHLSGRRRIRLVDGPLRRVWRNGCRC